MQYIKLHHNLNPKSEAFLENENSANGTKYLQFYDNFSCKFREKTEIHVKNP